MPQGEHSAILLTFIKLPFLIKTFVLSILERQHARIQEFSSGGVQVSLTKKSSDVFFVFF